jgi:hypothetical protein
MPSKPQSSRPSRSYDKESGKNRTKGKGSKKPPPPPESSSEDEAGSDSELESELEMPARDDSQRKKKAPPPPARKGKKDGRTKFIKGEQDQGSDLEEDKEKETTSKVAPHMMLLLAATYHVGISSISRPSLSSFVPYAGNMFQMLFEMCNLVVDNTLLHEMCPEFFTPAIYLYYGHVFYYHVLRARAAAGSDVLTRLELRILKMYERVGPAESWPVAAPLIGFLHYMGSHKVEDPMFGWIVPNISLDFTVLQADATTPDCLGHIGSLLYHQRIPIIPAMQKLVRNFAHGTADFNNQFLRPTGNWTLGAANIFCGLQASTAASANFVSLAHNHTWLAPLETGNEFGIINMTTKRNRLNRWNIPDVPDNADLRNLQNFLGFIDGQGFDWMKHLLSMASKMNRFFPGSTNLAEIPPLTTLGMATQVEYRRTVQVAAAADDWYPRRTQGTFSANGYANTETGLIDSRASLTVSPNASFHATASPAVGVRIGPNRLGPFFTDGNGFERYALPITETSGQIDPTQRFAELLTSYYDNKGGRA